MTRTGIVAAGVAAALVAMPVAAQDTTGGYVSLRAGIADVKEVDLTYYDQPGTFGGTGSANDTAAFRADTDGAFQIGGAVGYDFGMVRADVQVDYARNKIKALTLDSVNGQAVTLTATDGQEICAYLEADGCSVTGNSVAVDGSRLRQLSAIANLWLDIPTGVGVTPYVGGGVGVGGYEVDGEGTARFAWQLGAGVAFNISPTVALTADYRRRQISGANIDDDSGGQYGVIIDKVKTDSFTAGLRFTF